MDDREHLLHAAEREDGEEKRATALDGVVNGRNKAGDFVDAFLTDRALGGAARRLGDERVEVAGRKLGTEEGALVLEKNVAGEENLAVLVVELDGGCARHVTGGVKNDFDFVLRAAKMFGMTVREAVEAFANTINLVVGEERIVGDVGLVLLAHHDIGRIMQHALDEHAAGRRHNDGRVGVLAHHHWQAADVIEMAVRYDDQVERDATNFGKIRGRRAADALRI